MEQPDDGSPADDGNKWVGLKTRVISGAVLMALLLGAEWVGGWFFTLVMVIAAILMVKEWNALTEDESSLWRFAGIFYAAIPCASLIWLRGLHVPGTENAGAALVLHVFLIVWATDIGAYFVGRSFGKYKLAPSISPGKTWEGLGGGILFAAIVSAACHSFSPFPSSILLCIALGALLAVIAQAGDLFESWMKRRAGVKDSGTLIPGHGGLLDRIDGLIFAAPLFAFAVWVSGYSI